MLMNPFIQLVALILLALVLFLLKKRLRLWPKKLLVMDIISPLYLVPLAFFSQEIWGLSLSLYLIFSLALLGLLMTLKQILVKGDIILSRFLRRYWLLVDLVLSLSLLVVLVNRMIVFFN